MSKRNMELDVLNDLLETRGYTVEEDCGSYFVKDMSRSRNYVRLEYDFREKRFVLSTTSSIWSHSKTIAYKEEFDREFNTMLLANEILYRRLEGGVLNGNA